MVSAAIMAFVLNGTDQGLQRFAYSQVHMGGRVDVTLYAGSEDTAERAARAAFAEGRIGEAEALLKQLLSEDNQNAPALILYARCLAERGELGEAETVLNAVPAGDDHKQALAGARAGLNEA